MEPISWLAFTKNPLNCQCLHHLIVNLQLVKSWPGRSQFRLIRTTAFLTGVFFLGSVASVRAGDKVVKSEEILTGAEDAYLSPTNGLGSWIWASNTFNGQICHLWKTFEIPEKSVVAKAGLVMTADNEFTLYLDGRKLGHGAEWHELFVFDLSQILSPGRHVLAVEAINGVSFAGMLFGLRVDLTDGHVIEVKSDKSWRIVPEGFERWEKKLEAQPDWPEATIMAPLGGSPWWTQPLNVDKMPSLLPLKVYFWQTGWFQITLICISGMVILISLRLMAQLTMHRKEHWLLQRERARIARDIHDDIGARMTQLVLHGEVAQSGLRDGSEAQLHLVQICDEARGLLSTMDEILWAVNPKRDTLRDFAGYVCNYAQEFLKSTPIQCLFELDPEMSAADFTLPLRRSLLMAIKETLNNAVKHSAATELHLKILWQGQRLVVVVQDNGKGFDPAIVKSERHGMSSMAQRMTELGGSCLVISQPGKGCRVELSIPLKHPRQNLWPWAWSAKHFSEPSNETRNARTQEPSKNHDPTQC